MAKKKVVGNFAVLFSSLVDEKSLKKANAKFSKLNERVSKKARKEITKTSKLKERESRKNTKTTEKEFNNLKKNMI